MLKSIPELIGFLKTNPDKLTYGSIGTGQSPHLAGAWFLQPTGSKMTHVPFRGSGPALQAALHHFSLGKSSMRAIEVQLLYGAPEHEIPRSMSSFSGRREYENVHADTAEKV
jgi:tripartite-type tricarboxylate transporter receptor subunit TctC